MPPLSHGPAASGDGRSGLPAEEADPRFALLVATLSARLRPVCQDWDDGQFQALVVRMARLKVRWDDAYRAPMFDGDGGDRH